MYSPVVAPALPVLAIAFLATLLIREIPLRKTAHVQQQLAADTPG